MAPVIVFGKQDNVSHIFAVDIKKVEARLERMVY